MANLSDLIPTKAYNKIVSDKRYVGKTMLVPIVEAKDGTTICKDIPENWASYVSEAVNNYHRIKNSRVIKNAKESTLIAEFVIPGGPVVLEYSNSISQNAEGTYYLCPNKEYIRRIKSVNKNRTKIIQDQEYLIPFMYPVEVSFVFKINENRKCNHNLPGLIESGIDLLERLKIIKNKSPKCVAKIGECKIKWLSGESFETTVVRIKSITEA